MSDPVLEAKPILERFRLDGRVALVTGGGQGIGRAFAHALGEAGAAVAVVDLRLDLAEAVAHELAQKQIDAIAVQTDVTKPDQVQAMVNAILAKWGALTIGVNNAGVGVWADAEAMAYAEWLRVIDINLNSVFLCAQAEANVMLPAGYGKIINTASMSGHISNTPQNQSVYNASKAGVLHLTRSLAAEWARRGVRVNSISPGYTLTPMNKRPEVAEHLKGFAADTPAGRIAAVDDMVGPAIFLASQSSAFCTGVNLLVDGGFVCW